jgi:hypothetical protein
MPRVSPSRRPPAACTIVSRNYLSFARVLARSYLQHEPGGRFYLLIVDGLPKGATVGADVHLLGPDDLRLPYFYDLLFIYDVAELCTAVKPTLLSLLFNRFQEEEVIFFDPDILIMRPLEELREPLASASIVLTPNLMKPLPSDGRRPNHEDILVAGAYNLGFIALRKTDQALDFLRWWEERLSNGGATVDVPKGLMTDQKWIDLVPPLFPATVIFRDETYNVAWWNIHHRFITRQGDQFLVNGRPLTFFHFSGFDPSQPQVFTKECENRTKVLKGTPLGDLIDLYADLNLQNGYAETKQWRYGYSRFENGTTINLLLRRLYLDLDADTQKQFGDPFRTGPGSFLDWATRPDPREDYLSHFLLSLYKVRFDLPAAFPDIRGRDREGFLEWAKIQGSREMKFDPEVMRIDEARGAGRSEAAEALAGPDDPAAGPDNDAGAETAHASAEASADEGLAPLPPKHVRRYNLLRHKIREVARVVLPPAAAVAVVGKGDDELLKLLRLDGYRAEHFPQAEGGGYAGHNPADSAEAIAHLEAMREQGTAFLLFPGTALWWLEHYVELEHHLKSRYRVLVDLPETCMLIGLGKPDLEPPETALGAPALVPSAASQHERTTDA